MLGCSGREMKPSLPASSWPGQASVLSLYSVTPVTARAKTYQFGLCQELKRATPKMAASRPAPPPPIRCSQVRRWSRRQQRTGARIRGRGSGRRSFEHRPAARSASQRPVGTDPQQIWQFMPPVRRCTFTGKTLSLARLFTCLEPVGRVYSGHYSAYAGRVSARPPGADTHDDPRLLPPLARVVPIVG